MVQFQCDHCNDESHLVPSSNINMDDTEVQSCEYFGYEIRVSKQNETSELNKRLALSWGAYGRLRDILKSDIPVYLKEGLLVKACYGL